MDKLSHLITEAIEKGSWTSLRARRHGPSVSHLMFADDVLLVGEGNCGAYGLGHGCAECVLQLFLSSY